MREISRMYGIADILAHYLLRVILGMLYETNCSHPAFSSCSYIISL